MSEQFPVWILLQPSEEIEGEWTAHCLELDVMSQGKGPKHAYEMGVGAAAMAMKWDFQDGLDPKERKQAPNECFQPLNELLAKNERREVKETLEASGSYKVIAVRVEFDLDKLRELAKKEDGDGDEPLPLGEIVRFVPDLQYGEAA